MVITSNSSTSWLALFGSLVGVALWPLRKRMRLIRWASGLTLLALHLVMKAPVWALISRVDVTGSSSGYHRYELVDNCIRHFSQWWLIGYNNYPDWGFCMYDLCDQWVVAAVKAGLVGLVVYIAIFSRSFGAIGTARKQVSGDRSQEWLFWCLGSNLFAVVVAQFGINYMAQLMLSVFTLLACISVATFEARQATVRSVEATDQEQFAVASGVAESVSWVTA
jgi:hypothetical protein